jgi:hypothetical protein
MLSAGLIRQESTFQADAVSPKDAVGLMQVLPKTGKLLARRLKVRYTKNKLFEPDFNLQVGMVYVSGLLRGSGAPEYALAAFNAGEDRIAAWRAGARRVHSVHRNARLRANRSAQRGSLPHDLRLRRSSASCGGRHGLRRPHATRAVKTVPTNRPRRRGSRHDLRHSSVEVLRLSSSDRLRMTLC